MERTAWALLRAQPFACDRCAVCRPSATRSARYGWP